MTTKPTENFVPIPKGTHERINILAFASQLDKLYKVNKRDGKINYVAGLCGPYFMFHSLYDHLTEKGFKIEFQVADGQTQEDVKKHLWDIAKASASIHVLRNGKTLEYKKDYQIKLYKSELLYLCLVQHFNLTGKELSFDDEEGNRIYAIKRPNNIDNENNIIKYLELKASKLHE